MSGVPGIPDLLQAWVLHATCICSRSRKGSLWCLRSTSIYAASWIEVVSGHSR